MSIETWTPERIAQLRNFVLSGLTCSQIAAEIGVTRNAVIGKIHRLGLSSERPPGASAHVHPPRVRRPRPTTQRQLLRLIYAQAPGVAEGDASAAITVDSAQPCSLLDLAQDTCRWPVGETESANFAFCGNATSAGFPYCVGHARMAYRMPARRRA